MAVVLAVVAFGVLIAFHEAGHMWVARRVGMRVDRYSIGFGPVVWRWRRGETEYALSAVPLGGYVKIAGMGPEDEVRPDDPASYANKPAWARLVVILAGPVANYLLAFLLGIPLLMTAMPAADPSTKVGGVVAGSPAERAGLEAGDLIVVVDGHEVHQFAELSEQIGRAGQDHPGAPIVLTLRRAGGLRVFSLRPDDSGHIGVTSATRMLPPLPFFRAVGTSFVKLGEQSADSARLLGKLFTGKVGVNDLSGPVGMISQTVSEAKHGLERYFETVWVLSVAIGFFNLLPIPALDGGRAAFLLVELVFRRKVNQRLEATIHTVGLVALLGLILYVSKADVARLFLRR